MRNELRQLRQLLESHARIRAEDGQTITLASGKTTTFYFDSKPVIQSPEGVPLIGALVWEKAKELGAEGVGGLSAGCIPIADAAVAYGAFNGRAPVRGFYVRDSAKDHGIRTKLYQAFATDGRPLISPGRRVLIVDDVITTGGSIAKAIDEVERNGAIVAGVYVIIDREDPAAAEPGAIKSRYQVDHMFTSDDAGNLIVDEERRLVGIA